MKQVFLPIFLFFCLLKINAQSDSIPARPLLHNTVTAHIKGHPYETKIEKDFFMNDFELVLSDSSYKIIKYHTSWVDTTGTIYSVPVKGSLFTKTKYRPDNTLDKYFLIDEIIIQKGDSTYYVPSLIINITDAPIAQKNREALALCTAFISGYQNNSMLRYTDLRKDLTIELTDKSYKIVSFELVMEDDDYNTDRKTKLYGAHIPLEKDEVTKMLTRLHPGNTVLLDNFVIEKGGKLFHMDSLIIYIK